MKFIGVILLAILQTLIQVYTAFVTYNWFLVPIGAPVLSMAQLFGIMIALFAILPVPNPVKGYESYTVSQAWESSKVKMGNIASVCLSIFVLALIAKFLI